MKLGFLLFHPYPLEAQTNQPHHEHTNPRFKPRLKERVAHERSILPPNMGEHFTAFEPQDPPIDAYENHKICGARIVKYSVMNYA